MAVTKLLSRKERLDILINYVMNGEKTEEMYLVSGINCLPETAIKEMNETKEKFGKKNGNIAYHLIQSFDGNEVSKEQCHEIGVQYARQLFGDDFQVIVATHVNTKNVHNHIVINSVSFKTGRKFYNNRETKDYIRVTSDFFCKLHQLSVIETPWKYKGYYKKFAKNDSYLQMLKKDVDVSLAKAFSTRDFETIGQKDGYYYANTYDYGLIVYDENKDRTIFMQTLFGDEYSYENTKEKILDNSYYEEKTYPPKKKYVMSKEEYSKFIERRRNYEIGKLPMLYVLICLLLKRDPLPAKIEIGNVKIPITKEMRIELKYMKELSEQAILLTENKIKSLDELNIYRGSLETKVNQLKGKREGLWVKMKKAKTDDEKDKIKAQIEELSPKIKKYNNDIMNCFRIEKRSVLLKRQLEIEKLQVNSNECDILKKKKNKSRER